MRVPSAVGSNENDIRCAGKPSSGLPDSSTKESITSKEFGASIERNSHDPDDFSPRGPFIE
ncbi:hypothetical protein D3C80_2201570 [compost metagenome]